jgi:hypothetical protein
VVSPGLNNELQEKPAVRALWRSRALIDALATSRTPEGKPVEPFVGSGVLIARWGEQVRSHCAVRISKHDANWNKPHNKLAPKGPPSWGLSALAHV